MSTTYDEPDPADDIAQEWADMYDTITAVDGLRWHVHRELVAVAAWELAGQDTAADEAADRLREHLDTVDHTTLVEALIQAHWPAAVGVARHAHSQTRREIRALEDPPVCPDPEGHRRRDRAASERAGGAPETSWWRRARGRCGWCGRPLPREGRHRA